MSSNLFARVGQHKQQRLLSWSPAIPRLVRPTWTSRENAAAIRADCAGLGLVQARTFFRVEARPTEAKNCDSGEDVLHVATIQFLI